MKNLKGIVLAGGLGTRLLPLTKTINKHLLNLFDKPLIYYPIETLVKGGIKDLTIVVGEHGGEAIIKAVGNGKNLGLSNVSYHYQQGEGGIADALNAVSREWVGTDPVVVCLGDNIFEEEFDFKQILNDTPEDNARIFIKVVNDPERFGVVKFNNTEIDSIIEKPDVPPSGFAVTGLYIFPGKSFFNVIDTLQPSGRGELEVTDLNNYYIKNKKMNYSIIEKNWTDAGTFDSLLYANVLMASRAKHKKHLNKFQKVMSIL